MALKKKPVTGMKDILPAEMAIRDYVIRLIKETYGTFGFSSIETPCVEHIENLSSKQGGENEKLIFKILKRGEKLKLDTAETEADLVDGGLRYDLTLPLSRYYSNHANELPSPFKALQMGNVWRADRPQRGRYRQFMQCDIDILGEPTNLAEIELILATTTLLGKLDFKNFTIRINDRRILKSIRMILAGTDLRKSSFLRLYSYKRELFRRHDTSFPSSYNSCLRLSTPSDLSSSVLRPLHHEQSAAPSFYPSY